jgi:hydrogenase nickel incorporation protein HypA/HybF
MHELGIAAEILETAERELRQRPGARLRTVAVSVGAFSGVEANALHFAFDALVESSSIGRASLEIEHCPLRYRCAKCAESFVVNEFDLQCPRCGTLSDECVGGQELEIRYLEIEDEPGITRT